MVLQLSTMALFILLFASLAAAVSLAQKPAWIQIIAPDAKLVTAKPT